MRERRISEFRITSCECVNASQSAYREMLALGFNPDCELPPLDPSDPWQYAPKLYGALPDDICAVLEDFDPARAELSFTLYHRRLPRINGMKLVHPDD